MEPLVEESKKTGLEINAVKIKHMFKTRDQNAGQDDNIWINGESSEMVEDFKYMKTAITDQNCIHEEIRDRLKSRNASYDSMKNYLSSNLLSR
jgi:hypothetical protein